ncbi:MAG TPA: family 1 glycosylhydrolase [Sphingomonas sp.]|jgi:dTDP-4-dehydrorhamnose reductase|uniref:family 1 glycosylhydrolase n=1 Tax=Sphingomonas sp. TaxID=28214 RepID=UPI002ED8D707
MRDLELWGGPECTVNRVGDDYGDQFARSGHDVRADDIDRFAQLGIKAIRYPILWEKLAPNPGDRPEDFDWSWHDGRLNALRDRGIRVIAGLVHHGSGPRHTNLLAPDFASGLAAFATAVARRYNWITDWTPVNEPVTTARFSALYGLWYPHHRSDASFWLALLNQIDAVRLSMQAIRRVNRSARLVQTEDLGRTFATAAMRDRAAHDNVRRWASWDLLCGRVVPGHPFWERLSGLGHGDRLKAIAGEPCPPDVIGINHYLTSDRFLDHRMRRYPMAAQGGHAGARFADVEAIRVLQPPPAGMAGMVRETWARYGIPIAITEVHNGCTREEQMRWLADAWDMACAVREDGVVVEAVTAWSLLGSAGWNTLLTRPGIYEVGAYDVSSGAPRETAVVPLLRGLASGAPRHPVLEGRGWWRRSIRLEHRAVPRPAPMRDHARWANAASPPPLLICGAGGRLGRTFVRACVQRDIRHVALARPELDVTDAAAVARAIAAHAPWAVVNATGWTARDAEADPQACARFHVDGAVGLARACAERGIATLHFSTDQLFDGMAERPYVEDDVIGPRTAHGRSKAAMEAGLAGLAGAHLIIRSGPIFGVGEDDVAAMLDHSLSGAGEYPVVGDRTVSPTYAPHLVNRALDLLIDDATGVWHLAPDEPLSWIDFLRRLAVAMDHDPERIRPATGDGPQPRYSALASRRGASLGPIDQAIADCARARGPVRRRVLMRS